MKHQFYKLTLGVLSLVLASQAHAGPGFSVVPVPAVPSSLSPGGEVRTGGAEDDAAELMKHQKEMQKTAAQLNQINPLAAKDGTAPESLNAPESTSGAAPVGGAAPTASLISSPEVISRIRSLASAPALQKVGKLAQNPDFIAGVNGILPSPDHGKYLAYQLAFLVVMMAFRSWRARQHDHWLGKLWVRVYCLAILLVVSTAVIPTFVYGDPWKRVLTGVQATFFES